MLPRDTTGTAALGLLWPERSIAQSLLQHYDVDPGDVPAGLLLDFAQTVGEELLMLARDYLGERGLLRDEDVSPELAAYLDAAEPSTALPNRQKEG